MLSEVPITLWPIAEKISHELEIAGIFSLGPNRKTHYMQQMHNGATNHVPVILYNRESGVVNKKQINWSNNLRIGSRDIKHEEWFTWNQSWACFSSSGITTNNFWRNNSLFSVTRMKYNALHYIKFMLMNDHISMSIMLFSYM